MEELSPKKNMLVGQLVYLVEPGRRVREAQVWSRCGDLYTVRFADTLGGIRVRGDRLFLTRAAALSQLHRQKSSQPVLTPVCLWHNVPLWEC